MTEVPFFGNRLTSSGLQPDPNKIRAIMEIKPPDNRTQLENILGVANYLQRFSAHLADMTGPMRALLKHDSEFIWDHSQTDALEKMKQAITQQPVLA